MHIVATQDPVLVDAVVVDTGLPAAREWLHLKPWTILVAMHDGQPVAGAMVLDEGEKFLPEVHLAVPKIHRGPTTIAAIDHFRAWVRDHRPHWHFVWTYSMDPESIAFAQRVGFRPVFMDGPMQWLCYDLLKGAE